MKNTRNWLWVSGLAVALTLSGCFDDDDDDVVVAPVITEVPDSAGASAASFISYLLSLSGSDETSEPLTLKDTFAVPADETSEPTPLT